MSVTGILIVISLMLALQLDNIAAPTRPSGLSQDTDPVGDGKVALEAVLADLVIARSRLEMLQAGRRSEGQRGEVEAEIARMEESITRLKSREQANSGEDAVAPLTPGLISKIAEIERLKQETERVEARLAELDSGSAGEVEDLMALEKKVREMESVVARSRLEERKLRLIPESSETTKEPVIVVLSGKDFTIIEFDRPDTKVLVGIAELERALANFRQMEQYFVLFVRPSGTRNFEEVRNLVREAGFEVGYDAIDETTELTFGAKDGK